MKLSYLPDGMTETEEGKYSYEQTPGQGGISIVFYQMDTGDEAFWMQDHYVTESEIYRLETTMVSMKNAEYCG